MGKARHCLIASLPLLMSGCVSLHSNQPVQQQYVLSLPAAGGEHSAAQPAATGASGAVGAATDDAASTTSLRVLRPVAAAGRGGDGIALLRSGQRLDYYGDARWVQGTPVMVQALLVEALRRAGHFGAVESDEGPFAARYVLSVELTHFEADYGDSGTDGAAPTVHVALTCTLGARSGRGAITTLTVNSTVSAAANHMQAVVDAFQRATEQALTRIAQQLTPPDIPDR